LENFALLLAKGLKNCGIVKGVTYRLKAALVPYVAGLSAR
jgi:hypothetical protein